MDEIFNYGEGFYMPPEVLDKIQNNIEDVISKFNIPDANKFDIIKKINFMYTQARHMSLTDGLTGLYNRRHFSDCFEREFLRAKRYGSDLSFAMVDVDSFKEVNDSYGHGFGDYLLKEVAYILLNSFRKTDVVFRYGGDEFAILITETSKDKALIPLERFRKAISDYEFNYKGKTVRITVSIGVADVTEEVTSSDELFDVADKALYSSKASGKNCINF